MGKYAGERKLHCGILIYFLFLVVEIVQCQEVFGCSVCMSKDNQYFTDIYVNLIIGIEII